MSSSIRWYNQDRTIILWEQFSLVTWAVTRSQQETLFAMLDEVSHTVDIIALVHEPYSVKHVVPNLKRLITRVHPNEGIKVVVNAESYTQEIFSIMGRVNHAAAASWHFVATLQEAEQFLNERRRVHLD